MGVRFTLFAGAVLGLGWLLVLLPGAGFCWRGRSLHRQLAGMCARRRSHFLSLRRKKVTKERATPLSATPALRYGATCGARSGRGLARTRHCVAQTVASPDPPSPALLGADRGEDAGQPKAKSQKPKPRAIIAFGPWRSAKRAHMWPSAAKARVDVSGTQPPGSPFFWVRFFGEAKKSTSPAGARPGLRPLQRKRPQKPARPRKRTSADSTAGPHTSHKKTTAHAVSVHSGSI